MTIKDIKKVEIDKAGVVSSKLRSKFQEVGIRFKEENITDFRDIYEICSVYIRLIDSLVQETTSMDDIVEILNNVEKDLYTHLPYHCKALKRPLKGFLDKTVKVEI